MEPKQKLDTFPMTLSRSRHLLHQIWYLLLLAFTSLIGFSFLPGQLFLPDYLVVIFLMFIPSYCLVTLAFQDFNTLQKILIIVVVGPSIFSGIRIILRYWGYSSFNSVYFILFIFSLIVLVVKNLQQYSFIRTNRAK